LRTAALLGIPEGPAFVLFAGTAAAAGAGWAALVPGSEAVVAVEAETPYPLPADQVSPIRVAAALPFGSGALNGVVLGGGAVDGLLEEGIRVLGSGGRLVVPGGGEGTARKLMDGGLGL